MIFESIQFQFDENGRTENSKPIELKGINLFVGANNSGKSFALNEIRDYFAHGQNPVIYERNFEQVSKYKPFQSIKQLRVCYNDNVFKQIEKAILDDFGTKEEYRNDKNKMEITTDGAKRQKPNVEKQLNLLNHIMTVNTDRKLENLKKEKKVDLDILLSVIEKKNSYKLFYKLLYNVLINFQPSPNPQQEKNSPDMSNSKLIYADILFKIIKRHKLKYLAIFLWEKKLLMRMATYHFLVEHSFHFQM